MELTRLVVLASGVGSRLRSKASPKPLARLAGITLLERTLAAARDAGFEEVIVVTGYRADVVDRHVMEVSRRRGIAVRLVHNERYREGNGLAILAARAVTGNEPFALVMGDHVFSPSLLPRLRGIAVAGDEVVVVVDPTKGRGVGVDPTDAMKVQLDGDRVRSIGKDLAIYDAFDIGAFVCSSTLFDAVETALAHGDSTLAAAIRVLASERAARSLAIEDDDWWFDVDTPSDHRNGTRHLLRRTSKPVDGAVAARINRVLSQRTVTPLILRLLPGVTPNQVTLIAFAVAVAAAVAFAAGAPIIAATLVALSSVLDGSDGELARLTHRSSRFGGFLDASLDRAADGLLLTGASVYLATSTELTDRLGGSHLLLVLAVAGVALSGHLLVSYTTAKAALDLDHCYKGSLVGGGHGRDLRLGLITVGALLAAFDPAALLIAVAVVAVLTSWTVVARLRASWWARGPGRPFGGVRAVALDFDGTVIDSMGLLADLAVELLVNELSFDPAEARTRYLETSGADFDTQLTELAPGDDRLDMLASRFEKAKADRIADCLVFADVGPALTRLAEAGVPVMICSSSRAGLVRSLCEHHGIERLVADVDGWAPDRDKVRQLLELQRTHDVSGDEVVFVGDSRRDADVASAAGTRFVGLARPTGPDLLAGSGAVEVSSLSALADSILRAQRSPVVDPAAARSQCSMPTPVKAAHGRATAPAHGAVDQGDAG